MFIKEIFVEEAVLAYESNSPIVTYKKLDLFHPVFYTEHRTCNHDKDRQPTSNDTTRKVA